MQVAPFAALQMFLAVARQRSFSGAARELRVTRSAASQAVRQLERHLDVTLLERTTRSVALTEAGRRLLDGTSPPMQQVLAALDTVAAKPGEATGRLRLSVPPAAVSFLEPVIAAFRARHHRVDLEIDVERRLVDVVADGYDAGVRLHEDIERDMIQVRLTDAFRWIVVGAPSYFARRGRPEHPDDLLRHDCINFRLATTGALYAWELARGRKTWRVPVPASIVSNDSALRVALATRGLGLAYAFEPSVRRLLADGQLEAALDAFAPTVPGFFLYYPRRARGSTLLRLFVDVARAVAPRGRVAAG